MKGKDISDALSGVNEKYVEESKPRAGSRVKWGWFAAAAAVLLVAVFGGYLGVRVIMNRNEITANVDPTALPTYFATNVPTAEPISTPTVTPYVKPPTGAAPIMLASAGNPTTPGYDDGYYRFLRDLRNSGTFGAGESLTGFYTSIQRELLSGGENAVCSPYNIYMALAMLAEITDGNTRAQILGLLGVPSVEELRTQYNRLFDANYRNSDDIAVTIPSASLWLRDGYLYNSDAIETLNETYRASLGSGTMGDPAYDALIEEWLNNATGGLLRDAAAEAARTDPMQVLKLISALYFKAQWQQKFNPQAFYTDVFHTPNGDREVEFMSGIAEYGWKFDGYTLAAKKLADGGSVMWFVLPDEGVTLESIIESGDPLIRILSGETTLYNENMVYLNMPKLDVKAKFSLKESLERLGVTDCFNSALADFSPLSDEPLFVSKVTHAARLVADNDGVEAAAFTVVDVYNGCAPTPPNTTVTLDRPFMFILTSADNTPLFVGTMYEP